MNAAAAAAALLALAVSAAGSALMAKIGPVDPPGRRTSHAAPTPTSGGLAIMAGSGAGLALYVALSPPQHDLRPLGLALGFAGVTGLLGALDDMLDLDARGKLAFGAVLALAFALLGGPVERLPLGFGLSLPLGPLLGGLGAALWIVTATNAVNFMDGANGFAPGALAMSFAALAVAAFGHEAPGLGGAALCGAAACAGFLPWNLGGRLFQGDAGALFTAFLFAALCLIGAGPQALGPTGLYFGPIALMPFLADVLLTLLARARRGTRLFDAHREHLYQRWLQASGRTHAALSARAALLMAGFGALAVASSFTGETGQVGALVLAVTLCVIGWTAIGRRLAT